MGGIPASNDVYFRESTVAVNSHFVEHVARLLDGNYDNMDHLLPTQPRKRFWYSSRAYVMSTEAAKTLTSLVREKGFLVPTFAVLMKLLDLIDGCYTAYPMLTTLNHLF